jgi:adenylate cyclase, class 2
MVISEWHDKPAPLALRVSSCSVDDSIDVEWARAVARAELEQARRLSNRSDSATTTRTGWVYFSLQSANTSTKGASSMKHEYEATFLAIDVDEVRARLEALGATLALPRTLLTRKIFDSDALAAGAWVRLRDEGTRTTLTLKRVTNSSTIDGTTEIETVVGDLDSMAEILVTIGLQEVRYQENYREEWRLGHIIFDLDTWPDLPTFLEIEGPDESAVRRAAADLGLDYGQAKFGSVDTIYRLEANRDILAEPTLLFNDLSE